ncbi:MAG: hypothetical protein BWY15_01855 [Firmicutes bacterium ADurb.Bin193]|nr:hypothetical protein [Clostridiaceae bacterium]OQB13226.1 MAG: hypothetical protein BWY15_01855 [Firmicutes bacterium ADurb.Bin193]
MSKNRPIWYDYVVSILQEYPVLSQKHYLQPNEQAKVQAVRQALQEAEKDNPDGVKAVVIIDFQKRTWEDVKLVIKKHSNYYTKARYRFICKVATILNLP